MIKASVTTTGWVPDNVFLERIKEAYRVWLNDFEPETSFLWSELIPAKRKAVHDALLGDGDLQALLSQPRLTDLYYGVDNLCAEFKSEAPSDGMAQRMNDLLYSLTVWVGNSRFANPEGGLRYAKGAPPTKLSVQQMLRMLPKLDFPNPFPGEVGLETRNGVASERAFQSYYQAARIRDYLRVLVARVVSRLAPVWGEQRITLSSWELRSTALWTYRSPLLAKLFSWQEP